MATLLIVDDSAEKRAVLRTAAARRWSGAVREAATTDEALALLPSLPDVAAAFIDYYIPAANGPAVIRAVRAAFPRAKIALVSSADNRDNAAEAIAAGADEIVCVSLPGAAERLGALLTEWEAEIA